MGIEAVDHREPLGKVRGLRGRSVALPPHRISTSTASFMASAFSAGRTFAPGGQGMDPCGVTAGKDGGKLHVRVLAHRALHPAAQVAVTHDANADTHSISLHSMHSKAGRARFYVTRIAHAAPLTRKNWPTGGNLSRPGASLRKRTGSARGTRAASPTCSRLRRRNARVLGLWGRRTPERGALLFDDAVRHEDNLVGHALCRIPSRG